MVEGKPNAGSMVTFAGQPLQKVCLNRGEIPWSTLENCALVMVVHRCDGGEAASSTILFSCERGLQ